MYFLEREMILNAEPELVWKFLATPKNLNELAPPELHFQILSAVPERMFNGLTILYRIRIPLFGSHRWLTEIKHIRDGEYFVDEQRLGPYRFWYHQHWIEPLTANRTRIIDRVSYELPCRIVGALIHKIWVKHMLEHIFDYRARRLQEIFAPQ